MEKQLLYLWRNKSGANLFFKIENERFFLKMSNKDSPILKKKIHSSLLPVLQSHKFHAVKAEVEFFTCTVPLSALLAGFTKQRCVCAALRLPLIDSDSCNPVSIPTRPLLTPPSTPQQHSICHCSFISSASPHFALNHPFHSSSLAPVSHVGSLSASCNPI